MSRVGTLTVMQRAVYANRDGTLWFRDGRARERVQGNMKWTALDGQRFRGKRPLEDVANVPSPTPDESDDELQRALAASLHDDEAQLRAGIEASLAELRGAPSPPRHRRLERRLARRRRRRERRRRRRRRHRRRRRRRHRRRHRRRRRRAAGAAVRDLHGRHLPRRRCTGAAVLAHIPSRVRARRFPNPRRPREKLARAPPPPPLRPSASARQVRRPLAAAAS